MAQFTTTLQKFDPKLFGYHFPVPVEIAESFIEGNNLSIEILVQRHKSRVFSYILLIVKNQELAEDIFQETFIKVIRSLKTGKYIDNGKFIS